MKENVNGTGMRRLALNAEGKGGTGVPHSMALRAGRVGMFLAVMMGTLLFVWQCHAADGELAGALQAGLFEEEANQDLPAAIRAYEEVIRRHDAQRQLAATAVFRLGECFRKLGRTNEAVMQFQRLVQEFPELTNLTTPAERNLAAMGISTAKHDETGERIHIPNAREIELIKEQIELAKIQLRETKKRIEAGTVQVHGDVMHERELVRLQRELALAEEGLGSEKAREFLREEIALQEEVVNETLMLLRNGKGRVGDEIQPMRELLNLKRELAALESMPEGASAIRDEEALEIQHLKEMLANSPDLINGPIQVGDAATTPLLRAVQEGKLRAARFLLENGADVNKSSRGLAPLHVAAQRGHLSMAELLIEHGADINQRSGVRMANGDGRTPLAMAAEQGFRTVAEMLLDKGADPNLPDEMDRTPLFLAVKNGKEFMLELLLSHKAEVDARADGGITPLHLAAACGLTNATAILLRHGADVSAQDEDANTPLLLAAQNGFFQTGRWLLKAQADPNGTNSYNATSLYLLAVYSVRAAGQPIRHKSALDSVHASLPARNDPESAEFASLLIEMGADPNVAVKSGGTPLQRAVQLNPIIVKPLLEGGGDPNLAHRPGDLPLFQAVSIGSMELVDLLLEYGANPNLQVFYHDTTKPVDRKYNNPFRGTPLMRGILNREVEIVQHLLTRGADVNLANAEGVTPLHLAIEMKSGEMAGILLMGGADPNKKSSNGNTPLHVAAQNNYADMAALLLEWKADPNVVNNDGMTPLFVAKKRPGAGSTQVRHLRTRPVALPPSLQPLAESDPAESPAKLIELLEKAGAVEWAPIPGQITYVRPKDNRVFAIFHQGLQATNRHTLLELIALAPLSYPDFNDITVIRRDEETGEIIHLRWNAVALVENGDCAQDQFLKWGDLVVVSERVHPLNVPWAGFPSDVETNILHCLKRQVTVSAGNQTKTVVLQPPDYFFRMRRGEVVIAQGAAPLHEQFRLKTVLRESQLLLSTSDLTHVRVKRTDPVTGEPLELTFNLETLEDPQRDFWVRDGDVIEVPEE